MGLAVIRASSFSLLHALLIVLSFQFTLAPRARVLATKIGIVENIMSNKHSDIRSPQCFGGIVLTIHPFTRACGLLQSWSRGSAVISSRNGAVHPLDVSPAAQNRFEAPLGLSVRGKPLR